MTIDGVAVLYVDDEPNNLLVFEHGFGSDFDIRTAQSGEEALRSLQEGGIGVLVTDQRMPQMSGNELLARVKELYPDIVRLVITAYSDLDPILRAVNDGLVARYIVKPWDRNEVREMLEWALDVYRVGRVSTQIRTRLLATERLATVGSISGAVLHDVNQPLAYLSMNVQRLQQLQPALPVLKTFLVAEGQTLDLEAADQLASLVEELPHITSDIASGCDHMLRLTRTIRDLLHPDGDTPAPTTDLGDALEFCLSVCRPVAMDNKAWLHSDSPAEPVQVRMEPTSLMQVLINLISNAAQAVGRKEPSGGRVSIEVDVEPAHVTIEIGDEGVGMSPGELSRVGTAFFTTRSDGTGLGLHQARRLVEGAGGTLEISSELGSGTTVRLSLPRGDEEP